MRGEQKISIHASRGGSDAFALFQQDLSAISIHASRGGSDKGAADWINGLDEFQSTLPAGEATFHGMISLDSFNDFNPRFPRGKRHTLYSRSYWLFVNFNPRFPRGKRQAMGKHARNHSKDFNPRFSRGKRLLPPGTTSPTLIFQSTLPAGEATDNFADAVKLFVISIHASRGGSDQSEQIRRPLHRDFNPRFPRGKRRGDIPRIVDVRVFQSTLPAGEATSIRFLSKFL